MDSLLIGAWWQERCFAFDIHKHTKGECWLKYQETDATKPKDPHVGHKTYPEVCRLTLRNNAYLDSLPI